MKVLKTKDSPGWTFSRKLHFKPSLPRQNLLTVLQQGSSCSSRFGLRQYHDPSWPAHWCQRNHVLHVGFDERNWFR